MEPVLDDLPGVNYQVLVLDLRHRCLRRRRPLGRGNGACARRPVYRPTAKSPPRESQRRVPGHGHVWSAGSAEASRAAWTKASHRPSNSSGVDSVRSGWHWTATIQRPSRLSSPSTRRPTSLAAQPTARRPGARWLWSTAWWWYVLTVSSIVASSSSVVARPSGEPSARARPRRLFGSISMLWV